MCLFCLPLRDELLLPVEDLCVQVVGSSDSIRVDLCSVDLFEWEKLLLKLSQVLGDEGLVELRTADKGFVELFKITIC